MDVNAEASMSRLGRGLRERKWLSSVWFALGAYDLSRYWRTGHGLELAVGCGILGILHWWKVGLDARKVRDLSRRWDELREREKRLLDGQADYSI